MAIPKEILFNYSLYVVSFSILLILPSGWHRLLYLHGASLIFGFLANDNVRFYVLLSMFHSAIHNIWPFLTENGYDNFETSTYDVFCHLIMMLVSYNLIKKNPPAKSGMFNILTFIFLIGSVLNCIASYLIIDNKEKFIHLFFEYTTIFQAISTGYWISTMLWFNKHNHADFTKHWLVWIILMSINWALYKTFDGLVGISMHFKYIEAVFIICTWGAVINSLRKSKC